MTDKKLKKILKQVRILIGIKNDETFFNYLNTMSAEESDQLAEAVEVEFGVDSTEFKVKLKKYLIMEAKPWVSEKDINL